MILSEALNFIYERVIKMENETIIIKVNDFLSPDLLDKISLLRGTEKQQEMRDFLTTVIRDFKLNYDHFSVIALTQNDEAIGYVGFIQNDENPKKWYYADLWVKDGYRRHGYARQLVTAGIEHLCDVGAQTLYTTVDVNNHASLSLQKSLGFAQIPTEPFNSLFVDGLTMFKLDIPHNFNCEPLASDDFHVGFICGLLTSANNSEALHAKKVQQDGFKDFFQEMKTSLQHSDPDEANFIIRKGIIPVAWLKINGLQGESMAWISMLIVHEKFQHQGIGSFAVRFAEDFARAKGFNAVGIHTNVDNTIAQNCYKKLGYTIIKESECTNGDGEKRRGLTFYRDHLNAVRMNIYTYPFL